MTSPSWSTARHSIGVGRERLAPVPDRLVGHGDASVGQEIVDFAEAEGESLIEPHSVADDRGREPVTGDSGRRRRTCRLLRADRPQVENAASSVHVYGVGTLGISAPSIPPSLFE
jgi:hypothetical protein